MKAKIPLLIAAGLFLATVSKAQYGGAYVNASVVIPGQAVVAYNDNHFDRDRYADRREWREDEGHRYGRYQREFWGDRDDYYRYHRGYRVAPYCAPRRVVVYGY